MDLDLKALREKKGLSQQELADQTGIPKGRINNWEQGRGEPKAADYKKLVSFFQIVEVDVSQMNNPKDVPEAVYKNLVEANTDYRLIPKVILDDYNILPKSVLNDRKELVQEYRDLIKEKNELIEQLKTEIKQLRTKPHTKTT